MREMWSEENTKLPKTASKTTGGGREKTSEDKYKYKCFRFGLNRRVANEARFRSVEILQYDCFRTPGPGKGENRRKGALHGLCVGS